MGLTEHLDSGAYVAVEWAERAESLLPPDTLVIRFTPGSAPDERNIQATSSERQVR